MHKFFFSFFNFDLVSVRSVVITERIEWPKMKYKISLKQIHDTKNNLQFPFRFSQSFQLIKNN